MVAFTTALAGVPRHDRGRATRATVGQGAAGSPSADVNSPVRYPLALSNAVWLAAAGQDRVGRARGSNLLPSTTTDGTFPLSHLEAWAGAGKRLHGMTEDFFKYAVRNIGFADAARARAQWPFVERLMRHACGEHQGTVSVFGIVNSHRRFLSRVAEDPRIALRQQAGRPTYGRRFTSLARESVRLETNDVVSLDGAEFELPGGLSSRRKRVVTLRLPRSVSHPAAAVPWKYHEKITVVADEGYGTDLAAGRIPALVDGDRPADPLACVHPMITFTRLDPLGVAYSATVQFHRGSGRIISVRENVAPAGPILATHPVMNRCIADALARVFRR